MHALNAWDLKFQVCIGHTFYFGNIYFLFNVNNLAGLSWRGNSAVGGIGGICQDRAKFKNDGKVSLVLK
jgi:hypothetical protein